jgi:hypothetical protein
VLVLVTVATLAPGLDELVVWRWVTGR